MSDRQIGAAFVALTVCLLVVSGSTGRAVEWRDSAQVARLFDEAGVRGTFVLYDVEADRYIGHDRNRAETRFIPASTFKLPNSLIGLATGAVESVDVVLPYGGQPQPFDAWEQDMSLRDAIRVSNVPVYQELARRIGLARMRENVRRLAYGNGEIGEVVDRFWLVGPLAISAMEQTGFLARLARGTLPFPAEAQASVREIARLEAGDGWTLYGKTGWCRDDERDVDLGWWVGWVETPDRVYAFALNIDMPDPATDTAKRVELGKASLKALGLL